MTKQEKFKPGVPSIRELIRWHNKFGRMLEPNEKGTKLFGVDGKEVEFTKRSFAKSYSFQPVWEGYDTDLGYCHLKRKDGSECRFRVTSSGDSVHEYLTYAECDLVLGSNYQVIDNNYSSPGPDIRKVLFHANYHMDLGDYNAFENGNWSSSGRDITLPVIYYRIPQQRFRELRDCQNNLARLVEAVREERSNLRQQNGE
jgi:hypothetical protein